MTAPPKNVMLFGSVHVLVIISTRFRALLVSLIFVGLDSLIKYI